MGRVGRKKSVQKKKTVPVRQVSSPRETNGPTFNVPGPSTDRFAEIGRQSPRSKRRWYREKEEELCKLWEEERILYDSTAKEYRLPEKRGRAYARIAAILKEDADEVEKHMRTLRTAFSKIPLLPSGSAADRMTARQREILHMCRFLRVHIKGRESLSNLPAKKKTLTNPRNEQVLMRKVDHHFEEQTVFQVDMDVMLNTRDYLYTRALECLKTQKDRKSHTFNPSKSRQKNRVKNFLRPSSESLPVTTESSFRTGQSFEVAGKQIQCESVTTRPDGSQFLCRNLWVDRSIRLPNWSLCPPRYNPDAWWQLNSIQSATFQVLDLEGFCQTIGAAAGMKGKVTDVKVAWDCDQTKPRMKWLDGKWAGEVDDNGFLRDLNCEYEPVT